MMMKVPPYLVLRDGVWLGVCRFSIFEFDDEIQKFSLFFLLQASRDILCNAKEDYYY